MARTRQSSVGSEDRGARLAAEALTFRMPIRISGAGYRPEVRTVDQAIDMIDKELPPELRRLPRWSFARALLEEAQLTRRKKDVAAATRQLRQALSNEGWLANEGT